MNELQVFNNEEFGVIRSVTIDGKIYFSGLDVAKALGYKRARDAVQTHCPHAVKYGAWVQTGIKADGTPAMRKNETSFIPEGDVYRLIVKSKLPTAEKFEAWVFDEVLPTIRKTGGYVNNDDLFIQTYLPYADDGTKVLFKTTLSAMRNMSRQLEEQKPLVEFAETVQSSAENILVRECSKLASNHIGVDIGEKRLYEKLRQWGMVLKHKNEPTQIARNMGILELIERAGTKNGMAYVTYTTKVTPKGQVYIVSRLIKEYNS